MRNTESQQEGHNEMIKNDIWTEQAGLLERIHAMGGFVAYAAANPEQLQCLAKGQCKTVCCMDERVASSRDGIAVAGSGILIKDDPEKRARFIAALRTRGITKLTSHEGCGALGLYAEAKGLSMAEAEHHMADWLSELASELGISEVKHLLVEHDFHHAVCAYVVLTENFTLNGVEGFPAGFQITAPSKNPVVSKDDLLVQVGVAVSIALSDHGFGERFTKEMPFTIVVVARDELERQLLENDPRLTSLIEQYDGRVVIDGFVVSQNRQSFTEATVAA